MWLVRTRRRSVSRVATAAVMALLLLALTACGGGAKDSGTAQTGAGQTTSPAGGTKAAKPKDTLVIGFPTDITTMDAHKATGLHIIGLDSQVGDLLVHLDDKGTPKPWLAESWEWQDGGKSLVLKIRDNVKMHDGNVLSAEDVRYSIERFRKLSIGAAALGMVKKIEALPGNKVRLSMDAPFAPLLPSLAYNTITIYSKAAVEKAGDDNFHKAPAGPGPYKFVEQKKGEYVKLEAFDDYWAGKPKTKYVIVKALPEMGARVLALESGDVDLIFNVSPQDAQRLEKGGKLDVLTPPSARLDRFVFNVQKAPFNNKLVRQAVAYAIDREAIVKSVFLGKAVVSHSPGPEGAFGYTGEYDVYKYNPEKAKELLKQAGHPNGLSFKFHLAPGRYLLDQNVAEAIRAQLKQVGIDMQIVQMEWGALSKLLEQPVEKNEFQAAFLGWRSINGDVDSAISDMHSKYWRPNGNNNSFYKNPVYDDLLEREQAEGDPAKRVQLLKEMQKVLMEDLPFIPLYNEPQIWAAKRGVKGVGITPLTCLEPLHTAVVEVE